MLKYIKEEIFEKVDKTTFEVKDFLPTAFFEKFEKLSFYSVKVHPDKFSNDKKLLN